MSKLVKIYTDGSCSGNPGTGGWGSVVLFENKEYSFSGHCKMTTNNRMEMLAVIESFYRLEPIVNDLSAMNIQLYTDSIYLKNGIVLWIKKWKQNNWKTANKKDVKNRDLWENLEELDSKFSIEWFWVKGHAEDVYNNKADKLARTACEECMREGVIHNIIK